VILVEWLKPIQCIYYYQMCEAKGDWRAQA
jgi:hypothetical protein